jgi:hypothetical protein
MRRHSALLTAALMLFIAACEGRGISLDADQPPMDADTTPLTADTLTAECSVAAQKAWLRNYVADWYLWAGSAPNPDPDGFATVQDYFRALLFSENAAVPADSSSSIRDPVSFEGFDQGQILGYGLFVNNQSRGYFDFVNYRIDLQLPLQVRFVEPQSPAGRAGLKRGDTIVSINGQASADVIAANDFAALRPQAGDTLELVVDDGAGPATYNLAAQMYPLTPVPVTTVLSSAGGIQVGYVLLSTFISSAEAALTQALDNIRKQGATELIVDLRYNGGGSIETATLLASLIAGDGHAGQVFNQLTYNAMHQAANQTFTLSALQAPAFQRVLVLTGPRTCASSELIVNGLRPFADVVTLGGTTCGEPFGEQSNQYCGHEYSLVAFEQANSLGQGQYYEGIAATCPVEDDFSGTLGSPSERLTAAALSYLDSGGTCPSAH